MAIPLPNPNINDFDINDVQVTTNTALPAGTKIKVYGY